MAMYAGYRGSDNAVRGGLAVTSQYRKETLNPSVSGGGGREQSRDQDPGGSLAITGDTG